MRPESGVFRRSDASMGSAASAISGRGQRKLLSQSGSTPGPGDHSTDGWGRGGGTHGRAMIRRMRTALKVLLILVIFAIIGFAGAWFWAGRSAGPAIEIRQPGRYVGQTGTLELAVQAPGGALTRVDAVLEQGGGTHP